MIRGFYTAVSGMLTAVRRMDVVVNNLANMQTTGYKQERMASTTFGEQLMAQLGGNADAGSTAPMGPIALTNLARPPELDLAQGAMRATGGTLDLALDGPGYLAVQTEQGTAYTRDGGLTRDADGFLTTSTGNRVLGQNGPIAMAAGGEMAVNPDGTILLDGAPVDQLLLTEFDPAQAMERLGRNLMIPTGGDVTPAAATTTTVHQGFVEASNVDVTGALTTMLEVQRAYEANQRLIQQQDEMLRRAVNDIARPGN